MAFSPTDIAGCDLWLKASTLFGADGSAVSVWPDQSGNGRDVSQANNDKRPLLMNFGSALIDDLPVVRFDGVDDCLETAINLPTSAQGTIFAVCRLNAPAKNDQVILSSSDEASDTRFLIARAANYLLNQRMHLGQNNDGVVSTYVGELQVTTGLTYLMVWHSDGSVYNTRLDGSPDVLSGAGPNNGDWFGDTDDRDNLIIGAVRRTTEGGYLQGDLAELIVYDTGLSLADMQRVEGYLFSRYFGTTRNISIPIQSSDVASDGTVYAGTGAVLRKSTDGGITWSDVYTVPGNPNQLRRVFIDSRGYIFVSPYAGASDCGLYRSIDDGASFALALALDADCSIWGMDEDSGGHLYIGEYSRSGAGQTQVWKSTDGGASWVQKYSHVTAGQDHVHDLRVDPSTGWVYITTGDAYKAILRSKDAGENWTEIYLALSPIKPLAISFSGGYVYWGSDNIGGGIYRFIDDSDTPSMEFVCEFLASQDSYVFAACEYGNKIAMFTTEGQINTDGNIWLFEGAWRATHTAIPAVYGFPYVSRNNDGGWFYVSHGFSLRGLKINMERMTVWDIRPAAHLTLRARTVALGLPEAPPASGAGLYGKRVVGDGVHVFSLSDEERRSQWQESLRIPHHLRDVTNFATRIHYGDRTVIDMEQPYPVAETPVIQEYASSYRLSVSNWASFINDANARLYRLDGTSYTDVTATYMLGGVSISGTDITTTLIYNLVPGNIYRLIFNFEHPIVSWLSAYCDIIAV